MTNKNPDSALEFARSLALDLESILTEDLGETLPISWPWATTSAQSGEEFKPSHPEGSVLELVDRQMRNEISAVDLVNATLQKIDEIDPRIRAWTHISHDEAIKAAQEADRKRLAGVPLGPLHGIPIGVKDIVDVLGMPTSAGSKHQEGFFPQHDAGAVRKLRAAGAIIVGKTNTHEYALGGTTPPTKNPWSKERIPGGSSGGSAAAVASGQIRLTVGTDSVGSVRIPSSICGVTGIRPTMGRVSRTGVRPLTWAMDTVGPIGRTVSDVAAGLYAMSGHDAQDPCASSMPVPNFGDLSVENLRGTRIGIPRSMYEPAEPEILSAVENAIDIFRGAGAHIIEIEVPYVDITTPIGMAIFLAESAEYHRKRIDASPQLFDPDTLNFLELAQEIPATLYIRALRVQRLIAEAITDLFHQVDAIVVPTLPCSPAKFGTLTNEFVPVGEGELTLAQAHLRNNLPFALAGVPASRQPCGFDRFGLPIGLSIVSSPFNEAQILKLMQLFESATDWHERKPNF